MAEEEAGAVSPETAEGAGAEARQLLESLKNASVGDLVAAAGGGAYCFACTDASDGGEVFSESPIKIEGDGERLKTGGIGLVCRKGFLSEGAVTPNQDKLFVLSADDLPSVYGIFDGHGDNGHEVAQLVCESLPKLLLRDERFGSFRTEEEQTSMLKDAFEKMQQLLVVSAKRNSCILHEVKKVRPLFARLTQSAACCSHAYNVSLQEVRHHGVPRVLAPRCSQLS
eukprot:TRINITY_DN17568_c0_g1_i1.p1 TRINITY_DN17568_c0_g1~~TRINITY_DN17568_c0_g1_i1.p1  ORF type:complete len:226 (+),score=42.15 TRINITY_DN17568_c0_g1_i1:327-1004(+)